MALALAPSLAGCGRKGPLDPPPSAAIPSPPPAAPAPAQYFGPPAPTGVGEPVQPVQAAPLQTTQVAPAPQVQKKSFLLDPLIQ